MTSFDARFPDIALDPARLREISGRLADAADLLRRAGSAHADSVSSPADDPASLGYTARLTPLFAAGQEHLEHETAYLNELIAKTREALRRLSGQDADAARALPPVGPR
ncbi:hypothetical protein VA596_26290 [Amycolatopsis sp., V23-08]|uniref:PE domain-containing protein n=1 Tax=Amycolatopsis heterodermiae TaxID=3110235 RepID=A0ABU5R9X7_9PSEU|nr:hypothetical protein [Amycolatopsis sp., V23-08]MEA5363068.1 hypothetical protein [Amycolatopsis sp., V23-08]